VDAGVVYGGDDAGVVYAVLADFGVIGLPVAEEECSPLEDGECLGAAGAFKPLAGICIPNSLTALRSFGRNCGIDGDLFIAGFSNVREATCGTGLSLARKIGVEGARTIDGRRTSFVGGPWIGSSLAA